jgi:membrane protein implicated in regulation of membrane protease activity
MEPHAWQLWVIAGLAFGALEIKLSNFVMVWFGAGALAAAMGAAAGLSIDGQLLFFTASSVALFAASRTIFRRFFMRGARTVRTGTDAMVGGEATVIEALPESGTGTVRINGELWSARSLEGAVASGERVQVESLDGLKLNVRRRRTSLVSVQTRGETR